MVLKDANQLVKLYALVNVEQYTIVATGETQESAKRAYIERLKLEGIIDEDIPNDSESANSQNAVIVVSEIKMPVVDGNTVVYITDEKGTMYREKLSLNEALILVKVGDALNIDYIDTDIDSIKEIVALNDFNK